MDENPDSRTLITLADLKGFLEYMDNTYGSTPASTRSLIMYLIQYIEKEAAKQQ